MARPRSKSTQKKLLYKKDREEYSNYLCETQDTDEVEDEEDTQDMREVEDEEDEVWSKEEEEKFERWFCQKYEQPKDISSIPFGVGIGMGNPLVEVFEGSLTLIGLEIAAQGYDVNSIEIDLMDGRHELCQGYVTMDYYQWDRSDYDRPLTEKVEGANGFSAEVTYATFTRAVVVFVEIKLPKMAVSDPIKVYGKIKASISGLREFTSDVKTTLFKKQPNNYVIVSADGGLIPLSKSLVVCPVHGTLKLHLNLALAKACIAAPVKFKPKCFGGEKGDRGE